jgi:hypothetical protein
VRIPRPLTAALLLVWGCTAAIPAYPTGENRVLPALLTTPELWADRFVALEGKFLDADEGPRGQAIFHIRAEDPDGESHELAVGSLVTPPEGWLERGDRIRLGGYFTYVSESEEDDPDSGGEYLLLAVCVVNDSKEQALLLPEGLQNCQAWSAGADPESLSKPR